MEHLYTPLEALQLQVYNAYYEAYGSRPRDYSQEEWDDMEFLKKELEVILQDEAENEYEDDEYEDDDDEYEDEDEDEDDDEYEDEDEDESGDE